MFSVQFLNPSGHCCRNILGYVSPDMVGSLRFSLLKPLLEGWAGARLFSAAGTKLGVTYGGPWDYGPELNPPPPPATFFFPGLQVAEVDTAPGGQSVNFSGGRTQEAMAVGVLHCRAVASVVVGTWLPSLCVPACFFDLARACRCSAKLTSSTRLLSSGPAALSGQAAAGVCVLLAFSPVPHPAGLPQGEGAPSWARWASVSCSAA